MTADPPTSSRPAGSPTATGQPAADGTPPTGQPAADRTPPTGSPTAHQPTAHQPAASQPPPPSPRSRRARVRRRRAARLAEARRLAAILRTESVGGALLLAAAVAALVLANSPLAATYAAVRGFHLGPASLGLDLTVEEWAADGLLAVFFFLVGLELKQEFTIGELANPRRALVPVAAAVGGMVAPALVYVAINAGNSGAATGWAIPTATDIAFALAVLAVVGRNLPAVLRTFLLTLAVADDLLAITVIALFYTRQLYLLPLLIAIAAIALFAVVIRWRSAPRPVRVILAIALTVVAWVGMHASGVHATVAGVLLGFMVPVLGQRHKYDAPRAGRPHPRRSAAPRIADRLDALLRPISAGLLVPLFAFFAAGVTVGGWSGLGAALSDRVAIGIIAGLVVGKTVGIFGTTLVVGHLTRSPLLRVLAKTDLLGLATIGGIGFTVSLLIGHLAFAGDTTRATEVQVGVLAGSLLAALLAIGILGVRNRAYRPGHPRSSSDSR